MLSICVCGARVYVHSLGIKKSKIGQSSKLLSLVQSLSCQNRFLGSHLVLCSLLVVSNVISSCGLSASHCGSGCCVDRSGHSCGGSCGCCAVVVVVWEIVVANSSFGGTSRCLDGRVHRDASDNGSHWSQHNQSCHSTRCGCDSLSCLAVFLHTSQSSSYNHRLLSLWMTSGDCGNGCRGCCCCCCCRRRSSWLFLWFVDSRYSRSVDRIVVVAAADWR